MDAFEVWVKDRFSQLYLRCIFNPEDDDPVDIEVTWGVPFRD